MRLLKPLGLALVVLCACPDPSSSENNGSTDAGPGGSSDSGTANPNAAKIVVDLRADVNRNGTVDLDDPTEDQDEDTWDATHGAVFLANIDDDLKACTLYYGTTLVNDVDMPKCNDAADTKVNGNDDLLDMAPLKTAPWADAPDDAAATIEVATGTGTRARLFRKTSTGYAVLGPNELLKAADLRAGVELYLEGLDIVRDPADWDGFATVTFHVTGNMPDKTVVDQKDTVKLRVSPVMTFHHLLPVETPTVARIRGDSESTQFVSDLDAVLGAAGHGTSLKADVDDQWNQDYFEPAYMSMPAPGGAQHVIRVNYRSANLYYPQYPKSPYRDAGVFAWQLRGKDSAAVQQITIPTGNTALNDRMSSDSLNSFGNTETIPPYELNGTKYPLGRLYRGSIPSFHPDTGFSKLLEAQKQQPPVYVDTSWLLVGHVDETVSFIKASTPRGWVVLANDAPLAKRMLEQASASGFGSVPMFEGMYWINDSTGREYSAATTIDQVLADTQVMSASAAAAVKVQRQLDILKAETGVTDQEIIPLPFLHHDVDGGSVAFQPGTVNLQVLDEHNLVVADPHGPVINGKDIFKEQLETALQPYGITVRWIDDWNLYHRLIGEVHCGTNSIRKIPDTKWWETGR